MFRKPLNLSINTDMGFEPEKGFEIPGEFEMDNIDKNTKRSSCPEGEFKAIIDYFNTEPNKSSAEINSEYLTKILNLQSTLNLQNIVKHILSSEIPISNHNKKLIITETGNAQGLNVSPDRNYNAYVYKYNNKIYKI